MICLGPRAGQVITQLGGSITRAIIFAIMITLVLGDVIFELGVADGRTGLFAAGLTLVISIALALFLGRHTSKVLTSAFAAILCATLLLPHLRATQPTPGASKAPESGNSDLPVILHLVLDEHIGLAGMNERRPGGERLARDLEAFYTGYGFRLFSQAYSQYFIRELVARMKFTSKSLFATLAEAKSSIPESKSVPIMHCGAKRWCRNSKDLPRPQPTSMITGYEALRSSINSSRSSSARSRTCSTHISVPKNQMPNRVSGTMGDVDPFIHSVRCSKALKAYTALA